MEQLLATDDAVQIEFNEGGGTVLIINKTKNTIKCKKENSPKNIFVVIIESGEVKQRR